MQKFDACVIGSGPAGAALAGGLASAGQKVAIIEKDRWGGTCPNYGCDPTKILMSAVENLWHARNMAGKGLDGAKNLTINWTDLMERKDDYSGPFSENRLAGFKRAKNLTTFAGSAHFVSSHKLEVAGEAIWADKITIATGQKAAIPDIPGKELLLTSNDFLALKTLPKRLIFIGAGYVALELAQIANAAGAEVTIITHGRPKVNGFSDTLALPFLDILKKQGIKFVNNIEVASIEQTTSGIVLQAADFSQEADAIVAAMGRIPATDELDLSAAGVNSSRRGIEVNDHLQTSAENIFALGDVVNRPQAKLTPVAGYEARYLLSELTAKTTASISYPAIPQVIFGSSKLASVGDTKAAGTWKKLDMTNWYSYKRLMDPKALAEVLVNAEGQIVAAQVLSTVADEMINFLTFLITEKTTLSDLKKRVLAYPTIASDLEYLY